ncbi:MAG: hypothetical protein Aureis2KO_05950 [Aureisphaera sp.]
MQKNEYEKNTDEYESRNSIYISKLSVFMNSEYYCAIINIKPYSYEIHKKIIAPAIRDNHLTFV